MQDKEKQPLNFKSCWNDYDVRRRFLNAAIRSSHVWEAWLFSLSNEGGTTPLRCSNKNMRQTARKSSSQSKAARQKGTSNPKGIHLETSQSRHPPTSKLSNLHRHHTIRFATLSEIIHPSLTRQNESHRFSYRYHSKENAKCRIEHNEARAAILKRIHVFWSFLLYVCASGTNQGTAAPWPVWWGEITGCSHWQTPTWAQLTKKANTNIRRYWAVQVPTPRHWSTAYWPYVCCS